MSYLFKALASGGKPIFLNQIDLQKMCTVFEGKELLVEFKEYNKSGVKSKLLSYYHAVVLTCASDCFRTTGEPKDTVSCDYYFRAEYAKVYMKDSGGNEVIVLKSKSDMLKDELLKFVTDCINFLESTFNIEVPNSQEFLALKKHGRAMKEVKKIDKPQNFTQI